MQAAARLRCYGLPARIEFKAAQAMEDWSATQYLKFEDDRTRPPRDLVAQVPLKRTRLIVHLGCGPGIQLPDNTREPALKFQREVGEEGPWRGHPEIKAAARDDLPSPEAFYDLVKPVASHIDIWHSVYNHVMASPEAITEWFKGSSLQPFLSPLNAADRERFLAAYTKKIIGAYKPRYDGKVLLRFPRLFILAVR